MCPRVKEKILKVETIFVVFITSFNVSFFPIPNKMRAPFPTLFIRLPFEKTEQFLILCKIIFILTLRIKSDFVNK